MRSDFISILAFDFKMNIYFIKKSVIIISVRSDFLCLFFGIILIYIFLV